MGSVGEHVWADNYTFYVVNRKGTIAMMEVVEADAGDDVMAVFGETHLKSSLVRDGSYHFYTMSQFDRAENTDADWRTNAGSYDYSNAPKYYAAVLNTGYTYSLKSGQTAQETLPSGSTDIVVTYDFDNNYSMIDLNGGTEYYLRINSDPSYTRYLSHADNTMGNLRRTLEEVNANSFPTCAIFKFYGNDPYDVMMYNKGDNNNFNNFNRPTRSHATKEAMGRTNGDDWYWSVNGQANTTAGFIRNWMLIDGGAEEGLFRIAMPWRTWYGGFFSLGLYTGTGTPSANGARLYLQNNVSSIVGKTYRYFNYSDDLFQVRFFDPVKFVFINQSDGSRVTRYDVPLYRVTSANMPAADACNFRFYDIDPDEAVSIAKTEGTRVPQDVTTVYVTYEHSTTIGEYVFHIIDQSGRLATTVKNTIGALPMEYRSPLAQNFRYHAEAAVTANADDTYTMGDGGMTLVTIPGTYYVTYDVVSSTKAFNLHEAYYSITLGGNPISCDAEDGHTSRAATSELPVLTGSTIVEGDMWRVLDTDPYALTLTNRADLSRVLGGDPADGKGARLVAADDVAARRYILLNGAVAGQYELMAALPPATDDTHYYLQSTGGTDVAVGNAYAHGAANVQVIFHPYQFYYHRVINKANHIGAQYLSQGVSDRAAPAVPRIIQSPLVNEAGTYHFWDERDVTVSGSTFSIRAGAEELTGAVPLGSYVYITYDYDNARSSVDLSGRTKYNLVGANWPHYQGADTSGNIQKTGYDGASQANLVSDTYGWVLTGGDPYDVKVRSRNVRTSSGDYKYLVSNDNGIPQTELSWNDAKANKEFTLQFDADDYQADGTTAHDVSAFALLMPNNYVGDEVASHDGKTIPLCFKAVGYDHVVIRDVSDNGYRLDLAYMNYGTGKSYAYLRMNTSTAWNTQQAGILHLIPQPEYTVTFSVVRADGTVAIAKKAVMTPPTGDLSLPTEMQSPYIPTASNYKYFTRLEAAQAYTADPSNAADARTTYNDLREDVYRVDYDIYVGYHYDADERPDDLPVLDGSRWYQMNLRDGNRYVCSNGMNQITTGDVASTDSKYLWGFTGDPYNIRIFNYGVNQQRGDGISYELGFGGEYTGYGSWYRIVPLNGGAPHILVNSPETDYYTLLVVTPGQAVGADRYVRHLWMNNGQGWYSPTTTFATNVENKARLRFLPIDVANFRFHLTTEVTGIELTYEGEYAYSNDNSTISIPDALRRKYCSYTFYADATGDHPAITFKEIYAQGETESDGFIPVYVRYTCSGMPFVFSKDYASAQWYVMALGSRNAIAWESNTTTGEIYARDTKNRETAAKEHIGQFAFLGDPYELRVINRNAGEGVCVGAAAGAATETLLSCLTSLSDRTAISTWEIVYDTNGENFCLREFNTFGEAPRYFGYKNYPDCRARYMTNMASMWVFPLPTYTNVWHIVNNAGVEVIKYTQEQAITTPITYPYIPSPIRSPFISAETIIGHTSLTGAVANSTDDLIEETPTDHAVDIFVRYTTDHLDEYSLSLDGDQGYNMQVNGQYLFAQSATAIGEETNEDGLSSNTHMWYLLGSDPYGVELRNVENNQYMTYDAAVADENVLLLGNKAKYFMILQGVDDTHYELMAATDDDASTTYYHIGSTGSAVALYGKGRYEQGAAVLQVAFSTNIKDVVWHIINLSGQEAIRFQKGVSLGAAIEVPAEIHSPLADFGQNYYALGAFDVVGERYTIQRPDAYRLEVMSEEITDIYLTYQYQEGDYDIDGTHPYNLLAWDSYLMQSVDDLNTNTTPSQEERLSDAYLWTLDGRKDDTFDPYDIRLATHEGGSISASSLDQNINTLGLGAATPFVLLQGTDGHLRLVAATGALNLHGKLAYMGRSGANAVLFTETPKQANTTENTQIDVVTPHVITYIIVDNSGREALRYQRYFDAEPVMAEALKSPMAKDYVFYKEATVADGRYVLDDADRITTALAKQKHPTIAWDIYVRYSYDPDGDSRHILSGGDWFTAKVNGKSLVLNATGVQEAATTDATDKAQLWKFIHNASTEDKDPYGIVLYNRQEYKAPLAAATLDAAFTPNTSGTYQRFSLLRHGEELALAVNGTGTTEAYYFLSTGSSGADFPLKAYKEPVYTSATAAFDGLKSQLILDEVERAPVTYYVITDSGHKVLAAVEPAAAMTTEPLLPTWARSPLLNLTDYQYYAEAEATGDIYTVTEPITSLKGLPDDEVYVRYVYHRETCPWTVRDVYSESEEHPATRTPLDITGETWYNLVNYYYGTDWYHTVEEHDRLGLLDRPNTNDNPMKDGNFQFQGTKPYMFKLVGGDPYEFKIYSAQKGNDKWLSSPTDDEKANLLTFSNNEGYPVQTFMLLNPNGRQLILVASEKINLYLANPRWRSDSKWLTEITENFDLSWENPFSKFSTDNIEFFKAPTIRKYVFHAMNCDDVDAPEERWSATLSRSWLTPVKLEQDIARLYSLYEKENTTNDFVTYDEAGRGRFYADKELTERIYDSVNKMYDVYPEVEEDETFDIYFKYQVNTTGTDVNGKTLAELTSTVEQIAADVETHRLQGRFDATADEKGSNMQGNWFFMVLDANEEYFLRRENDGNISWQGDVYALHRDREENYKKWEYSRLAEWNREGELAPFREGRWLWTLVGNDPYNMKIANFEGVRGIPAGENSDEVAGTLDSYITYTDKSTVSGDKTVTTYTLAIPDSDKGTTWGLAYGDNTGQTASLVGNGMEDEDYNQLYWTMTTQGVQLIKTGSTGASVVRLLPYVPVKYEDVAIHIRRNDNTGADATQPDGLEVRRTGMERLFFAASERMFSEGDTIAANIESLPMNVRRKFCDYTIWANVDEDGNPVQPYTLEGAYVVQAGPYRYGDPLKDELGNELIDDFGDYVYNYKYPDDPDGTQRTAQKFYVSYAVTTDMFLQAEPSDAELKRMIRENDHVYFMDFRDEAKSYDTGYHAYYKEGNTFPADYYSAEHPGDILEWDAAEQDYIYKNGGRSDWMYQTTKNRMESVPENLKWYFVGDPYALQVFCTKEPGHNLARYHDTETQFQFALDCVHLRSSEDESVMGRADVSNPAYPQHRDARKVITERDADGNILYEEDGVTPKKKRNTNYGNLLRGKFFWEVVPCQSEDENTFALRFKDDNTSLSYKSIYYYLAHNGISKTYTHFTDQENRSYGIDLSYDKDNALERDNKKFAGMHKANNQMTVIRLVQPTRLYFSAFKDEAQTEGGRMTRDELSEYFGLNEVLDNVPRHYRRKYADYYHLVNLRDNAVDAENLPFGRALTIGRSYKAGNDPLYTYTYNYIDAGTVATTCTAGNHPTFTKNPTFKFNVSYRPLDTPQQPYPFITQEQLDAKDILWVDVKVGKPYLYSDKYGEAADITSRESLQGLKGQHWALVGDPYEFQALNRRQYEGRINSTNTGVEPQTLQWMGTASATGQEVDGASKQVSYARMVDATGDTTDWQEDTAVGDNGNTTWSLCYAKTGNEDDYFIRTSSRKASEDEVGDTSDGHTTNTFGRLTTQAVERIDRTSAAPYYVEPFSLEWEGNDQSRAVIYSVKKDSDPKDNDCFDANVYIYKHGSTTPAAFLLSVELPYGDAIEALPQSLRRFGCQYTCYLDYDVATGLGTQTDELTEAGIAARAAVQTPVTVVYEYEVTEEAQKYFTTNDEAQQDAFNWTNGYYFWEQPYTKSSQEGIVITEKVKVGDHVNEDGKVDGDIYEYVEKTIYPETDGVTDAYGWLNTHSPNTSDSYADQRAQTDNNDQKWALVGDPYGFEMKNYAFYLAGLPSDVYAPDLNTGSGIEFSLTESTRLTIVVDENGKSYLALCDEQGQVLRYLTFDRVDKDGNDLGADDQNLRMTGSGTELPKDPTGNSLNTGGAKTFYLAGLKNFASVIIYHLVMGHQSDQRAYDQFYTKCTDGTLTDAERQQLKDLYGLTPGQLTGTGADALTYQYRADSYYENGSVNSLAYHIRELKKYGHTGSSLRDYINFPIDDFVSYDVGVGNRLSVPWYMRRQFCGYTLYRRDVLRSVPRGWLTDGSGNPLTDADGNYVYPKDERGDNIYTKDEDGNTLFAWESTLTDEEKQQKVLLSTVQQDHKDRMLIIDVVYDVDETQFRFSDKGRNTTAWYSLMTQNPETDGLMNFSYKHGIGARPDRTTHYTNNYLWAPTGDPYGFTLHNRYATVNGTGWDNVVVTTTGKLPQQGNEQGILSDTEEYGATYTGAEGKVRYIDSRIVHLGKGELRNDADPEHGIEASTVETWGSVNAVYEMLVSNFPKAFLMHPTSAPIDVNDKEYSSNFMYHEVTTHKSDLRYGKANTFRSDPEACWRLETTAEQLWPYFERSGYVGGLDPTKAMRNANRALRTTLEEYINQPAMERDFSVLDEARELVYKGTFYNARTGATVAATDKRPAEGLRFQADNLINMQPGYYRIRAFSEKALDIDGQNLAETGRRGIVGPRYISGYRFKSEMNISRLSGDTPEAGGRWLHFYETDEAHTTIHTFGELNSLIEEVDAATGGGSGSHNFSGRDIDPHPSMRGNIEIPAVEYDPSSIFYFNRVEGDNLPGRYTLETQGLRVRGRAGGTQTPLGDAPGETVYGVTRMEDPTAAGYAHTIGGTTDADLISINDTETYGTDQRYNLYDDRFRIDDIGGTAMTLRLVDPSACVMRTEGSTTTRQRHPITDYASFEETLDANIQTNYLCIDRTHRYRITVHWDNEMVEIGDHHAEDFATNGIQDTKWLLQPVGVRTQGTKDGEFYNEVPLRLEVHQGGNHKADNLGTTPYYYGSLYVPFDTRLNSTVDAAFTGTYKPNAPTMNLSSLSTMNNMGNGQFIPALWPVIVRSSSPKKGLWRTWNPSTQTYDEHPDLARRYVELYLPNTEPSQLGTDAQYRALNGVLDGQLLEQTVAEEKSASLMVFGLPFKQKGDRTSYSADVADNKSAAYYAYADDEDSRTGFYTNENWAREGWDTSEGDLGAAAYEDVNERQGNQHAYEVDARTATYAQRSNRYLSHNRVYYVYPRSSASPAPAFIEVHFEGDEEDDEEPEPEAYMPGASGLSGRVYDLGGRLRATGQTPESLRRNVPGLPAGIYLYRGKKVVVR